MDNNEVEKSKAHIIVEIIDLTGRLKTTGNIQSGNLSGNIDIVLLPKGLYICVGTRLLI